MHLATNRINHVDVNMVSLYAVICFLPFDPYSHALPLYVQLLWNSMLVDSTHNTTTRA